MHFTPKQPLMPADDLRRRPRELATYCINNSIGIISSTVLLILILLLYTIKSYEY